MTMYRVTTKFYDNGKVTASVKPIDYPYTKDDHDSSMCDVYQDDFKTQIEANKFANEARAESSI